MEKMKKLCRTCVSFIFLDVDSLRNEINNQTSICWLLIWVIIYSSKFGVGSAGY